MLGVKYLLAVMAVAGLLAGCSASHIESETGDTSEAARLTLTPSTDPIGCFGRIAGGSDWACSTARYSRPAC